ncbi:MAG TPA: asparagine synthase (glutamine-hydrolyzing), partial [Gemmatimonadales bacterium]|nr:asparagine synthase (glutamine-hydrolyzing) [Gemmatimonadales bacterium]
LALIDLSAAGRQPMTNETGEIQVIFNGEIYNHQELRALLQARGHVFRSTSDTEVLVHLYEERGERMVELLRGIFAFAIYDAPRRRLLLARDRFGVKPLFYLEHEGQLAFASEIKALTALPRFTPEIDRQACWDFVGLGYIPEPATGFAQIRALEPGTFLVQAPPPEGRRTSAYHSVAAAPEHARGLSETVALVRERLLEAVKRQAVADVPVAALLSGGIDSSLVVAAHRRATGERTTTFNVRFPDPRHDETPLAIAVADHIGTEHNVIELGDYSLGPDELLKIIRHFDQPFADTSCIPMYWVSRAIRDQGIICTLSGDGGDEAFGGYGRFSRANRLARLMALPAWARAAAIRAGKAVSGVTRDLGRQLAKAAELAEGGRNDSAIILAGLSNYLSEDQKQRLFLPGAGEGLEPVYRHFDGYRPAPAANLEELSRRMTEKLFAVSLPSDMLRKVDMMSMRASIEVRVPLLDEQMVALGLTLPHHHKTNGREGKLVLRALAKEWLPTDVARHPKHGFSIPLDVMASPAVHGAVENLLLAGDARTGWFCDRPLVQSWLSRFREAAYAPRGGAISRAGLYQRVFTLLSLETWMRDHNLTW